jgi:hypothetical protein
MRLAQKMIVGGALFLDRVANSHLYRLSALPVEQLFSVVVDEFCRFSSRQDFEGRRLHGRRRTGRQLNAGTPSPHQSGWNEKDQRVAALQITSI